MSKAYPDGPPAEYFFREGCFIQEWLNSDSQQDMSIARVRVEAGRETRLHMLQSITERYVMIEGSRLLEEINMP